MDQNTRKLLEDLRDLPAVDPGLYDVDQILAEFGGGPVKPEEASPPPEDCAPPGEPAGQEALSGNSARTEIPSPEEPSPPEETAPAEERPVPGEDVSSGTLPAKESPQELPAETAAQESPAEEAPPEFSLEDVVAGTVETVLDDQEKRRQEAERRRQRKLRRQQRKAAARKPKAPPAEEPDFSEPEPSLVEMNLRMKHRRQRLRRLLFPAAALTAVYWVLLLLGDRIPRYGDSPALTRAVPLVLQGLVTLCAWPVLLRAGRELRELQAGWALPVSLSALVTLADAAAMPHLPARCAGEPLGGPAMVALVLALWGASLEAGALRETFRMAALGPPLYLADTGPEGAVKGEGDLKTFYNRTVSENTAALWQRLMVPVILTAALVFAILSSFGRGEGQSFLWCLSGTLTAGTALSLPLVYGLPYYRLALRLGKSGGALAGGAGAGRFALCRTMVLRDGDLFPPGCVRLNSLRIFASDRRKAASYASSLADALEACYAPLLRDFMQEERGRTEPLVHFHIHEDGGASAAIYGETAILGSALTLRKQGVRLPRSLEEPEGLYLAIDGELAAIFALEYTSREGVEWAIHAMKRNGFTPLLALRDGSLNPRFLKQKFGSDGGAQRLDAAERGNLARPARPLAPNGLLYREGLAPFFEVAAGGKRLEQSLRTGSAVSLLGSCVGTLLGYYLVFAQAVTLLTPALLMAFLLLWLAPALFLGWSVDQL